MMMRSQVINRHVIELILACYYHLRISGISFIILQKTTLQVFYGFNLVSSLYGTEKITYITTNNQDNFQNFAK